MVHGQLPLCRAIFAYGTALEPNLNHFIRRANRWLTEIKYVWVDWQH